MLTKFQRSALKRIFDRHDSNHLVLDVPLNRERSPRLIGHVVSRERAYDLACRKLTYLQFRRLVRIGHDCIMLQWCGIWLGVEADGYTHS